ncbi:hypothetical protein SAMN04487864_101119 [Succiniclasticum ruminis]|uniref:Uncharacterized protein n=1 Tax=Succiniclasticum ruminis TaxID=40841 RepID=A0A1G6HQM6_9FIRM|nr:hypothetical protein SAMN04487864_101119 [Succiniclasticum ruminis]
MNIFNRIISRIFKSRDKPRNAPMGAMQFRRNSWADCEQMPAIQVKAA